MEDLSSHLQMDFEADVKSNLFCARGKVLLLGNGSLPYLMLNATLVGDGRPPLMSTKYLLMQLEPNRDYSFEISKNMRIQPGDYNCTIEVSGPKGILASEIRKCSLERPLQDPESKQDSISMNAKFAQQEVREEMTRVESVQASEIARESTSKDTAAEKSVSNKAGNAAKNGETAIKDEAEGTVTLPREKEEDNGSLPAETVEVENDTSGGEPLPPLSVNASKSMLVGSSTSKKYHLSICRYAEKIKPENRIYFQSPEDAKRQGYLPCKSCNP